MVAMGGLDGEFVPPVDSSNAELQGDCSSVSRLHPSVGLNRKQDVLSRYLA